MPDSNESALRWPEPLESKSPPALPIETARFIATTLLVTYHVVGSTAAGGLVIDYPHPLRMMNDFLIDLRMPLFAFISGIVYAMKAPQLGDMRDFVIGKLRRLILPGAVAIILSLIAIEFVGSRLWQGQPYWHLLVFPFIHYWFLMSIFVIFMLFAPLDALTGGRVLLVALIATVLVQQSGFRVSPNLLSMNGAIYLAPFFLLGVVFLRHFRVIEANARLFILISLVLVAVASADNIAHLLENDQFSMRRRDLQSLAFGFGACIVLMLLLPRLPLLSSFGPYSFTIYLYHIFGTSAARRLLDYMRIDDVMVHMVVGITCGLLLPVLLHEVASRVPLGRVLVLGLRPKRTSATCTA